MMRISSVILRDNGFFQLILIFFFQQITVDNPLLSLQKNPTTLIHNLSPQLASPERKLLFIHSISYQASSLH